MKIAVIGAGAMGGLFGALLSLAGETVVLVDIRLEQVLAINTDGLTIKSGSAEVTAWPRAVSRVEDVAPPDLVLVFVKSSMTREAARSALKILSGDARVLTLQNGLGNAEILAEVVGADRVLVGTTAQGATLLGAGHILHAGSGDTHIGRLSGDPDDYCRKVAEVFSCAGIPTFVENSVQSLLWGKLVVNAGINALTALLGFRNGQLADFEETRELVALAVNEAVAVASAAGILMPYPDSVAKVLAVAKATGPNVSSMLQDIRGHRSTEIEAINGAIVREGERLGIPAPVNRTLMLLVQTLQRDASETDDRR